MGGNGILMDHNVGRFVADAEAIYSYEGMCPMPSDDVTPAVRPGRWPSITPGRAMWRIP